MDRLIPLPRPDRGEDVARDNRIVTTKIRERGNVCNGEDRDSDGAYALHAVLLDKISDGHQFLCPVVIRITAAQFNRHGSIAGQFDQIVETKFHRFTLAINL